MSIASELLEAQKKKKCIVDGCDRDARCNKMCHKHDQASKHVGLKRYKLTIEQYNDMFAKQDYKCAICSKAWQQTETKRWPVDHDHSCCPVRGQTCGDCIRGILCQSCNHALGLVQDNVVILQGMIDYLTR